MNARRLEKEDGMHGTEDEVARAKESLKTTKRAQLDEHVLGTEKQAMAA